VTDSLWRDDDYEPATLPSPAQLLHPELLQSAPTEAGEIGTPGVAQPPATIGPDGVPIEPELTRFIPRPRPGRFIVAAAVTAAVFCGVALIVAAMTGATGPKGVGLFFAGIGTALAGVVAVVWIWRWAGRRHSGIPTKRSSAIEVQGARPSQ
jgi:hypothetical protein